MNTYKNLFSRVNLLENLDKLHFQFVTLVATKPDYNREYVVWFSGMFSFVVLQMMFNKLLLLIIVKYCLEQSTCKVCYTWFTKRC